MEKKKTKKQRLNKIIVGGLRETIRTHGEINKLLIGSATKRIVNAILADKEEEQNEINDLSQ